MRNIIQLRTSVFSKSKLKMMFLIVLITIISVLYGLSEFWGYLRAFFLLRNFIGPERSSYIFGNWDVLCQPPEMLYRRLKKLSREYYPHCFIRIMYVPGLLILSPEDCEIFLSTPKHTRKSMLYNIFKRWLKDGLLISSGEKWQQRRKILTPAFHFSILKKFVNVFNEKADNFLRILTSKSTEDFNVIPDLQEFSLSAINETSMGHKEIKNSSKHKAYRNAVTKMEELFNQFIVRPWLNNIILYMLTSSFWQERKNVEILHNYTESIIKERMKNTTDHMNTKLDEDDDIYITKKRRRMAMLDILLNAKESGNQIDYEGICEEVDTFTFEGHDTVSTALSFCMLTIANHPNIQDEIFEEINSILGENAEHPNFEDLQKMDLLERCIKETLRLYPSAHTISRIVEEDTKLHSGLIAPRESVVVIPILFVHRNPVIYPDPEKFDPDRFLPVNCLHRHPYAYIPFSAGPRNCIGQRFAMLEMKVLLSAVIRNFKLVAIDTLESIELKMEAILRSKNGIKVKFIPRN